MLKYASKYYFTYMRFKHRIMFINTIYIIRHFSLLIFFSYHSGGAFWDCLLREEYHAMPPYNWSIIGCLKAAWLNDQKRTLCRQLARR